MPEEIIRQKEKSEIKNTKNSQFGVSQYSEKSIFLGNDIESQKRRSIKKILLMSSMDKETMKILLKILQGNFKNISQEIKDKLKQNASNILDKDKQKELDALLDQLENTEQPSDVFLQIIKYYVLSPVEKSYINKIEQELKKSQELDEEIKKVQENINVEKQKKLERYRDEKQGVQKSNNKETCEALLREVSVHENKLEKANQKLNEIVARNNQLREKINILRKEKNVIEEIYNKLKKELADKKDNVEQTIKSAGEAYYNRNRAEEELKALQEKAEQQKQNFENEYKTLNENIQYDKRFKQFIKSKQKEKEVLENLEKQIQKNLEIIEEKKKNNKIIETEYMVSAKKEQEIKEAFERIKKETGINETKEKESKELLNVFINLYQKNTIMSKFVKELNEEVDELERKIEEKKKEIQMYSTKGATNDNKKREMKIALTNKIQQEEKKKLYQKLNMKNLLKLQILLNLIWKTFSLQLMQIKKPQRNQEVLLQQKKIWYIFQEYQNKKDSMLFLNILDLLLKIYLWLKTEKNKKKSKNNQVEILKINFFHKKNSENKHQMLQRKNSHKIMLIKTIFRA
ncbi:hypothetical protein IMG5_107730 [Ichthyophthirius multifiliis]|uniref:ODAD1 central coiled coil region domain-containing protein n=1 Tax=Ichthyophthirius multifiliis TaxID=5932 RepID=G0QTB8_ICHMU|nr:hypothetical protein IMG5_107730 [Ichthyophthirius multifiliis]EGR31553.1 hypothetical protein IMG5_107730 [Ichthyophthirius multifiliis]|eukprot:XP_004035039.1 hypothetical protein IMG5_107730 [Ichthyophthirius multifiliis]